jgi:hypothetical protein
MAGWSRRAASSASRWKRARGRAREQHRGQQLERHAPPERLLDRLEHDPHAAATDLPHDAVGADALGQVEVLGRCRRGRALQREQRVERLRQLRPQVRVARDEVARIDALAAPQEIEELLDGLLGRGRFGVHGGGRPAGTAWERPKRTVPGNSRRVRERPAALGPASQGGWRRARPGASAAPQRAWTSSL